MSDLFVAPVSVNATNESKFLDPSQKVSILSKQVDWIITHKKSDYLKDLISLSASKSIAIRRKVAKNLDKFAPVNELENLKLWQRSETDRTTYLSLEALIGRIERGGLTESSGGAKVYTVDEVITLLKNQLGGVTYTIEGELGAYNPNYNSNAQFFNLKGAADDALQCMAIKNILDRLSFPFNEGLQLRLTGQFKFGKNARLFFYVSKIELTGEGELLRHLELLKQKLLAEGLFDSARKRPIPLYPTKILLIASLNSAALTDFTKVLSARRGGATIYQLPIKSQGVGAEESVVTALTYANQLIQEYGIECVVLTRGGGSQEDLHVFNSEKVVRALYSLHAPSVVAIGHERDTSIAEMVADLRCSTPSQAAELTSRSRSELGAQNTALLDTIYTQVSSKLERYRTANNQLWHVMVRLTQDAIREYKQLGTAILEQGKYLLYDTRNSIIDIQKSLFNQLSNRITQARYSSTDLTPALTKITSQLEHAHSSAEQLTQSIDSLSPHTVLKRGYTMVFAGSSVISASDDLENEAVYTLQFADGTVDITTFDTSLQK